MNFNTLLHRLTLITITLAAGLRLEAQPQTFNIIEQFGNTGGFSDPVGEPVVFPDGTTGFSFAIGAGTGDSSHYFGGLLRYAANGSGGFNPSTLYTFGQLGDGYYPSRVVVGDVNGDGIPDVIVGTGGGGSTGVGTVQVFSTGVGGVTPTATVNLTSGMGTDPTGLTVGPDGRVFVMCGSGATGFGAVIRLLIAATVVQDFIAFNNATGNEPVGTLAISPAPSGSLRQKGATAHGIKTNDDAAIYTLYGVTFFGGTNGNGPGTGGYGTVYKFNSDLTGFQTLHVFSTQRASNGYGPAGGMVLSGNTLYGATSGGGTNNAGTLFKMDTSGSNFTVLKSFSAYGFDSANNQTNSDGEAPEGDLILSGNTLYGTTLGGGTNGGGGVVYSINTNGGDFKVLHSFTSPSDNGTGTYTNNEGGGTRSGLLLSGNTLYGTTPYGGIYGGGTLFAISLPAPPTLNISPVSGNFTVSWQSSATNFALQRNLTVNSPTWTNFNGAVSDDGTNRSVSITPDANTAFFRLLNTNGP